MALPETLSDLAIAGYVHSGVGRCTGCGARIEWFVTPHNRRMPFSQREGSQTRYEPHPAVCPQAERFRRARKRKAVSR